MHDVLCCTDMPTWLLFVITIGAVVRVHEQDGAAGVAARIAGDAVYREACGAWAA